MNWQCYIYAKMFKQIFEMFEMKLYLCIFDAYKMFVYHVLRYLCAKSADMYV